MNASYNDVLHLIGRLYRSFFRVRAQARSVTSGHVLFNLAFAFALNSSASLAFAQHSEPDLVNINSAKVVFLSASDRCADDDIPDAPLRAFLRSDGNIVALSSHYINFEFVGVSLDKLHRDCSIVYSGNKRDPNARHFNYLTWIAATWTSNGSEIVALAHNEYHGNEVSGQCAFHDVISCWYNAIVELVSTDGGRTFKRADADGKTPLIAPSFDNSVGQGARRGFFNPTNIVNWNKAEYSLIGYNGIAEASHGLCLFRSTNPRSSESWSFLIAGRFQRIVGGSKTQAMHSVSDCTFATGLPGFVGSIGRLRDTNWFVAFSLAATADGSGELDACFSKNLMDWNGCRLIVRLPAFWSRQCEGGFRYNYPSVLDDGGGQNFAELGPNPILFLTRAKCPMTIDRDVVSIRIHLTPPAQ